MEKDRLTPKLAVILHADVVGSTALVQKNEMVAHERTRLLMSEFRKPALGFTGTG
jgi:class 3 adenylate cyclase